MRTRNQTLTVQTLPVDKPMVQYVRQSTKKQMKTNRVSRELQDGEMKRELIEYGWKPELILEAIAEDTGKSGTKRKDQRKGLQRLYDLIETGKVGAIAAFNVSRLYRTLSMAETGQFCDLVMEKGIPIVTKRRIYWPTRDDNKDLQADFQAAADYIEDHILGTVVAARDYNVAENKAYGGNGLPVGFQIVDTGDIKKYAEYKPHADKIRWLFRRYHELQGNLPMLHRELEHTNFRFPPLEHGIVAPLRLTKDEDGYYPLRNRDTLIYILTNKAYIGTYSYGESEHKIAHDAIVPAEDFQYAVDRLTGDPQDRKPTERRYEGARALLDGVLRSGNFPVYTFDNRYNVRNNNDRWNRSEFTALVTDVDTAFNSCFEKVLNKLNNSNVAQQLHDKIETAKVKQQAAAADYKKSLARIDSEIAAASMAQRVSQEENDEHGYREATKQLVQLRRDRAAIEAKAEQATSEASQLEECHSLVNRACCEWGKMKMEEKKRLVKLMMPLADISAPSPHFIRLRCYFSTPYNRTMDLLLYRRDGSHHVWSTEEDTILRSVFSNSTREAIMEALPVCPWNGINQRARAMGLRAVNPYTRDEYPLTWNDMQFMASSGAKVDHVVWHIVQENEGGNLDHPALGV